MNLLTVEEAGCSCLAVHHVQTQYGHIWMSVCGGVTAYVTSGLPLEARVPPSSTLSDFFFHFFPSINVTVVFPVNLSNSIFLLRI